MLVIDCPSKKFLERAVDVVDNGSDVGIKVVGKFRRNLLIEYLPYLIKNKDQKGKIWKIIFRWFYLVDFIALYGTIMEREDYNISYASDGEMNILFERRELKEK